MIFGRPTKLIKHIHDTGQIELDSQESLLVNFWHTDASTSASVDGTNINEGEDNSGIALPLGSIVKRHKVTTTIEPVNDNPINLYVGRVTLSFHDILAPQVCGQDFSSTGYQGTVTEANLTDYTQSPIRFYPVNSTMKATWGSVVSASKDIDVIKLNDFYRHFVQFSKITTFAQNPILGDRWQRIPKKAKRANPYTWTGLCFVNDSRTAGETVQIQIQQYLEELQLETPPTAAQLYT